MSSSSDNLFAGVIKGKESAKPAVATQEAPVAAPEAVAAPATAPAVAPEVDNAADEETAAPVPTMSQLDMLKNRARLMGIVFSNNIGIDALRAKIEAKQSGQAEEPEAKVEAEEQSAGEAETQPAANVSGVSGETPKPKLNKFQQMKREQMKLVRLRITNLDPKKKDLHGEIFTFGNRTLGTVRKFIPYGEQTDNGFHVPWCIYQQLLERQFLDIKVRKVKGREVVETRYVREFALEILPQLTEKEIQELKTAQMAAGSLD